MGEGIKKGFCWEKAGAGDEREALLISGGKHLDDVFRQGLFDLTVAGNRLGDFGFRVLIPVMPTTMTDEMTALIHD